MSRPTSASSLQRYMTYRKKLLKELEKWYHKPPPGMTKGRRKSKVPCQGSTVLPEPEWMKGFFWNLDPTEKEAVPRLHQRPRPQRRPVVNEMNRSERNSMESSLVNSAAIESKQAAVQLSWGEKIRQQHYW